MSVKIMSYVWEHSRQTGPRLLALLAIADSANDDGFCWLGMPKLSKKARQDDRNCRGYIQQIEVDGELIVYQRKNDDGTFSLSNVYKVIVPDTSDEPPEDLRGKLVRRAPVSAPITENTGGGGKSTPTPEITPRGGGKSTPGGTGRFTPTVGVNLPPYPLVYPSVDPSLGPENTLAPGGATSSLSNSPNTSSVVPGPEASPVPDPILASGAAVTDGSTGSPDPAPDLPDGYSIGPDGAIWIRGDLHAELYPDDEITAYPCTKARVNEMIAAWWDWIPKRPTKRGAVIPARQHFGNPANREYAENLIRRGVTPADFVECLGEFRYVREGEPDAERLKRLRDTEMTFCYAAPIVEEWVQHDREANWYTPDCPRVTPCRPDVVLTPFSSDPKDVWVEVPPVYLSPQALVDDADDEPWTGTDEELLAELETMGIGL